MSSLPIISFLLESFLPFALEEFEVEIRSEWDAVKERVAGDLGDGCDLRNALQKWKKVVYVKRGVLPENVGSHTNKTGRNTSHGRSGYSTGIGLCNSEGDHQ